MAIERINMESREELQQVLTNDLSQVEKDLTMICNNVPVNRDTSLDLLCHDENGQLVILQVSVGEDDTMLLQAMQSWDYTDKFKGFLKATYNKHKINDSEKPRLILVAPTFSDAVKRVVESMTGLRVDLYEWEYLKLGDRKGLRLQPVLMGQNPDKTREPKANKKAETKSSKKRETLDEVPEDKIEQTNPEPITVETPPEETTTFDEPTPEIQREETPKRKMKLF